MRSSIYQAVGRLSRASSKRDSNRPFSAASAYSDNSDGSALPAPLRNNKQKSTIPTHSNVNPTKYNRFLRLYIIIQYEPVMERKSVNH